MDFITDKTKALQYAERYVNNGSLRGSSHKNTTSINTSPFGDTPSFFLNYCTASPEFFKEFGNIPDWAMRGNNWIFIHPDMTSRNDLNNSVYKTGTFTKYSVVPTSSGRTVQFLGSEHSDYIKLHYDSILARDNRSLPFDIAVAGPEICKILQAGITNGVLPEEFSMFPEIGARAMKSLSGKEWGMIWRSSKIAGQRSNQIKILIPLFSLFSNDKKSPDTPSLLFQLLSEVAKDPHTFVLDKILIPIIKIYFSALSQVGIQLELHAQNALLGLSDSFDPVGIVIRDLSDAGKDLSLIKEIGADSDFFSSTYKCINRFQTDYQMIHSYMFDFRIGEYILEPIIKEASDHGFVDREKIISDIKNLVKQELTKLPEYIFPKDGSWYTYNHQFDAIQPYTQHPFPRFR